MTPADRSVRLELDGRRATVTLDRPPLNVLDEPALDALESVFRVIADHGGVHVVTIVAAGTRAFSAGVAIEDHAPGRIEAMIERFHRALGRLLDLDAVAIAAVQGHCLGGGLELATACDLLVATDDARFGQPEIALGCFPPFAAAWLPRRIGPARANDLILTGRTLDIDEAERFGIVSRRAATGTLQAAVDRLVEELLAHSGAALAAAKRALRAARTQPYSEAIAESERIYRDELATTEDVGEGVVAFLAKRPPRWRHR